MTAGGPDLTKVLLARAFVIEAVAARRSGARSSLGREDRGPRLAFSALTLIPDDVERAR